MAQRTTKRLPTTGVVIRAWRLFRGFSSTELAEKAGVRIGYLSEIEHDRTTRPYEDYLEKLADALDVPLEDILGRRMPLPTMANPAIAIPWKAIPDTPVGTTEEEVDEIEGLITSAGLSEEEGEMVNAALFEIAKQLISLIETQRKTRKED